LCLGLVLTFILAACTSEKNEPDPGTSSPSGGSAPAQLSSAVVIPEIKFEDFGIEVEYDKVILMGKIKAAVVEPGVRLEFLGVQPGWVSYKNAPVNGPLTISSSEVRLSDTEIDLTNQAINCGSYSIQVKACADANCKKFSTSDPAAFEKPAYLCAALSSSATEISSSSEAVWIFGAPTPIPEIGANATVAIGTYGSIKLTGDAYMESQPGIAVIGGTIRATGLSSFGDIDDTPVMGKSYSSGESFLGSSVPTSSTFGNDLEGVQQKDYFLIYFGTTVCLVRFEPKAASWASWPKQGTYWVATVHP